MGKSPYDGRTLPELYLFASGKGIKKFFPKNEKEMVKLLDEWDATHEDIKPAPDSSKEKKGFKDHQDEDLDELIDLDELDEDDVDVSPNQNTHREGADDDTDLPQGVEVEDDTDDMLDLDDIDDIEDDGLDEEEEDEPPQPTPTKGKGKMPKKEPAAPAKKAAPAPAAATSENKTAGMSPYSVNSGGHYVFIALKKGGLMETIVKNSDTLIAKYEVRPPSNTAQKVKIIMAEINKGKRDDKWGRFVLNEKTKKISWTSEV